MPCGFVNFPIFVKKNEICHRLSDFENERVIHAYPG